MIPSKADACRPWRDHVVESVYGELDGKRRRDFEAHLESCSRCRSQLASFEATSTRIAETMPVHSQPRELDVWRRLAPKLDAIDHPPRRLMLGYPAAASLAAVLLSLGLGLGLWLRSDGFETTTPELITLTVTAEPTVDPLGFARFLERSTPLLLAVANRQLAGPETQGLASASFDSTTERQLAERLAVEAADLADALETEGLRRQASLLRDLEIVFLQLANLPEQQYHHGLAMVQTTLEKRALLFQLSVEAMRHL